MHYIMHADGGSRGNPGKAAGAAVFFVRQADGGYGDPAGSVARYMGVATNNQAEYTGIVEGLRYALQQGYKNLDVRLDSELAVKQINGQYKVKNAHLLPFWREVKELMEQFDEIAFSHVRREFNKAADALVNETIDSEGR